MWKLIFKSLWSRRKRNMWLFAELVVVTVVTWAIIDPVIVRSYIDSLPLNYDRERLVMARVARHGPTWPRYSEAIADSISASDAYRHMLNELMALPEVENVAFACDYPENLSSGWDGAVIDTLRFTMRSVWFAPGWNFFNTLGVRSVGGSPSAEELSNRSYAPNDIVITKSLADLLFPGRNVVGQYVDQKAFNPNLIDGQRRIVGVIEDVRMRSTDANALVVFWGGERAIDWGGNLLIRLKPDVDPTSFVMRNNAHAVNDINLGLYFINGLSTYETIIDNNAFMSGATGKWRVHVALAVFFFVNLCLGVVGTFYLQTRKRTEDAGVMRSYGATPSYIVRMMLGEGVVLTTLSWFVGCLIYLQYAHAAGLATIEDNSGNPFLDTWVSNFTTHFWVVSLVVYAVMVIVVSIGIYLPARRISRVAPVDALRDE